MSNLQLEDALEVVKLFLQNEEDLQYQRKIAEVEEFFTERGINFFTLIKCKDSADIFNHNNVTTLDQINELTDWCFKNNISSVVRGPETYKTYLELDGNFSNNHFFTYRRESYLSFGFKNAEDLFKFQLTWR